ncbi:hypothetical protein VP191E371_P0054 [Vibrio phage 191E37-1]|nr:hypothetical protein VP191E371_P0054 [Vibrio phage 191E37-1]
MKIKHAVNAAKKILTCWDYSHLDRVLQGGGVVNFSAMLVKVVFLLVHVTCILTLPISAPIVVYIARLIEIRHLQSWVRTMRLDKGFFSQHYYIEIKRHISEHKSAYYLTMNW